MKLNISGVVINYTSISGLHVTVRAEVEKVEQRLGKVAKELKQLRRQRRTLRQMLGDQKGKSSQTAASTITPASEFGSNAH